MLSSYIIFLSSSRVFEYPGFHWPLTLDHRLFSATRPPSLQKRQASIAFLAYLFAAWLMLCLVEGWEALDAAYFIAATLTTVRYTLATPTSTYNHATHVSWCSGRVPVDSQLTKSPTHSDVCQVHLAVRYFCRACTISKRVCGSSFPHDSRLPRLRALSAFPFKDWVPASGTSDRGVQAGGRYSLGGGSALRCFVLEGRACTVNSAAAAGKLAYF